jgi:hypothetical protein
VVQVGCRVLFLFTNVLILYQLTAFTTTGKLRGDLRELPMGEAREGVQVACALPAMVISISRYLARLCTTTEKTRV